MYDFGSAVAGFQFDVSGLSGLSASGGAAGDAGFEVSAGAGTIIGFSLTGAEISGSGVLTVLSFDGIVDGMSTLSLGNFGAISGTDGSVFDATVAGSIDHGDQDCAGDYYGSAINDNCGACDSDSSNDCAQDCAGTWGGTLTEDCAGVCGGDSVLSGCDLSLIHI